MKAHIEVSSPVELTPRVLQMSGMFDMPADKKSERTWDHELLLEEQDWNVGLIMGPSGAGKTVMAEHMWPGKVVSRFEWSPTQSVLDGFPAEMGIKDVTGYLSAVGLGSPPAWVRPFWTLSGGEAFRATIARALAESENDLVVVDEFTSVVDRQVAKVASHTVQKAVRRNGQKLIAVTCHYDVEDWLQPDWTYDVAAGEFSWRSVQPHPPISIEIRKCPRALWRAFAVHHYLTADIHPGAQCFAAYVDGRPIAFSSYLMFPHPNTNNIRMGHRLVVLPDWQGLGLAGKLDDWLGQYLWDQGLRYRNSVAHPAMIRFYARSPRWREVGQKKSSLHTSTTWKGLKKRQLSSRSIGLRSFEYTPPKGQV